MTDYRRLSTPPSLPGIRSCYTCRSGRSCQRPTTAFQVSSVADLDINHSLNDYYMSKFQSLSSSVAYVYPNPGEPRLRRGRSGGGWRHVNIVQGPSNSRFVYIDGRVRQHDSDTTQMHNTHLAIAKAASCPSTGSNRQTSLALPSMPLMWSRRWNGSFV